MVCRAARSSTAPSSLRPAGIGTTVRSVPAAGWRARAAFARASPSRADRARGDRRTTGRLHRARRRRCQCSRRRGDHGYDRAGAHRGLHSNRHSRCAGHVRGDCPTRTAASPVHPRRRARFRRPISDFGPRRVGSFRVWRPSTTAERRLFAWRVRNGPLIAIAYERLAEPSPARASGGGRSGESFDRLLTTNYSVTQLTIAAAAAALAFAQSQQRHVDPCRDSFRRNAIAVRQAARRSLSLSRERASDDRKGDKAVVGIGPDLRFDARSDSPRRRRPVRTWRHARKGRNSGAGDGEVRIDDALAIA